MYSGSPKSRPRRRYVSSFSAAQPRLYLLYCFPRTAIFGLDDLRMLTRPRFAKGKDAIQETVNVYCDAKTYAVLEQRFP
jgi:hypothetical protein